MYGDVNSRAPSSAAIDPNDPKGDFATTAESRTGIEVVELANGETIWWVISSGSHKAFSPPTGLS